MRAGGCPAARAAKSSSQAIRRDIPGPEKQNRDTGVCKDNMRTGRSVAPASRRILLRSAVQPRSALPKPYLVDGKASNSFQLATGNQHAGNGPIKDRKSEQKSYALGGTKRRHGA